MNNLFLWLMENICGIKYSTIKLRFSPRSVIMLQKYLYLLKGDTATCSSKYTLYNSLRSDFLVIQKSEWSNWTWENEHSSSLQFSHKSMRIKIKIHVSAVTVFLSIQLTQISYQCLSFFFHRKRPFYTKHSKLMF